MLILPVLITVLITGTLCAFARPVARRMRLLDFPDARKQHHGPTPLMGGVTLMFGMVPVVAALATMGLAQGESRLVLIWCISVAIISLVGMLDDRHSLSPKIRLIVSFLVFVAAALIDSRLLVRFLSFESPPFAIGMGSEVVALVFTTVCCVGLLNAVNMADGKNGLVTGLSLIWVGFLLMRAPPFFVPALATLAAVLLILFIFNLRGRLFLGDGGAYGVATAVGMAAIIIYNTPGGHAGRRLSADELVLLFAIPVFDSFRLTYVRLRRGQSPMSADRDHLHHYLQDHFGWPGGLIIYLALAALVAVVGLTHPFG